jgi:hypothetical protein
VFALLAQTVLATAVGGACFLRSAQAQDEPATEPVTRRVEPAAEEDGKGPDEHGRGRRRIDVAEATERIRDILQRLEERNPTAFRRVFDLYAELSTEMTLGMQKDPEMYEELAKLRHAAPDTFREEISAVAERYRVERLQETCLDLSERYHHSADPEERELLRSRIVAAVEEEYAASMRRLRAQIRERETELDQLHQTAETRAHERKAFCERRVEALLTPPAMRWEWP